MSFFTAIKLFFKRKGSMHLLDAIKLAKEAGMTEFECLSALRKTYRGRKMVGDGSD